MHNPYTRPEPEETLLEAEEDFPEVEKRGGQQLKLRYALIFYIILVLLR